MCFGGTRNFQHSWQKILFPVSISGYWTHPKASLMENVQPGADFCQKPAPSTIPKYSFFSCKIPHPHVALQQDLCVLEGFKELIPCRGCSIPKPDRCGWQTGDAVMGNGPRAPDSTEEVMGALLVGTAQTRQTTIAPHLPLVREAGCLY